MAALRPQIVDALVVGAGPAGLNAALVLARLQVTALVFDSSTFRNEGIKHMHSVASRDHSSPYEFRRIAREQITSRYQSVWFENTTITHASKKLIGPDSKYDGFELKDNQGKTYQGKKIILATGSRDILPDIPGYKENWPDHIYQCLACDGFEQRNTPIGILGADPMTSHFVDMAQRLDKRVTIFSNGPVPDTDSFQQGMKLSCALGAQLDERKITRLVNNGPTHVEGITIEFETGEPVTLGFLAHRPPTVNRAQDLIEQLKLETGPAAMGGNVKIVDLMCNETSTRGVFAAGDTMLLMKQAALSMAEGLKAGAGVMKQLGEERIAEVMKRMGEVEKKAE